MKDMSALRAALKQRKSKGVDINIMLNIPKDGTKDDGSEKSGLAPDLNNDKQMMAVDDSVPTGDQLPEDDSTENGADPDEAQDVSLIKKLLSSGPMGKRGMMYNRGK